MTAVETFELVLALMALTIALRLAGRPLHLPPAAALVLGGGALALVPGVPGLALDPALVLLLFLPPLVFQSAYLTDWRAFRADLRIILQLAVGAILFTTLLVGFAVHVAVPTLPLAACFALGAIVSPPDAVAAKAVLGGLGLPPRMLVLLEGESLINDATGIVAYRIAVAAALTGEIAAGAAAGEFLLLAGIGLAVGIAGGLAGSAAFRRLADPHLNTMASFLLAWGLYIAAERLHGSGILAVVAGGLIVGRRQHRVQSALARLQSTAVWKSAGFVLESLVFVLIGLSLRGVIERIGVAGAPPGQFGTIILVTVLSVVLARFLWIVPTAYLVRAAIPSLRRRDPYPPIGVPVIMSWAGMRGVVSLAIALGLPEPFPGRDLILAAVFAVILFTVLVQGPTLGLVARLLPVRQFAIQHSNLLSEGEVRLLLAESERAAAEQAAGDDPERRRVARHYAARARRARAGMPGSRATRREVAGAAIEGARATLLRLDREGRIADDLLGRLEHELDLQELALQPAERS